MVLPIYLIGTPVLRRQTNDVSENSPELQSLLDDMIETMHASNGIGLAAPQIGRSERIFVVDISPLEGEHYSEEDSMPAQPMVFINATIHDESEEDSEFEEGCLSIPDVHEEVVRARSIRITYQDRDLVEHDEEFDGILSRVIQHEYDHVDGILFIDHITPFRRRLLKRRIREISEGNVDVEYPTFAEGKGILTP